LNGFGAGPAETIGPAVIADLFFLHDRGNYNTLYFVTYFGSLMVGAFIVEPGLSQVNIYPRLVLLSPDLWHKAWDGANFGDSTLLSWRSILLILCSCSQKQNSIAFILPNWLLPQLHAAMANQQTRAMLPRITHTKSKSLLPMQMHHSQTSNRTRPTKTPS